MTNFNMKTLVAALIAACANGLNAMDDVDCCSSLPDATTTRTSASTPTDSVPENPALQSALSQVTELQAQKAEHEAALAAQKAEYEAKIAGLYEASGSIKKLCCSFLNIKHP